MAKGIILKNCQLFIHPCNSKFRGHFVESCERTGSEFRIKHIKELQVNAFEIQITNVTHYFAINNKWRKWVFQYNWTWQISDEWWPCIYVFYIVPWNFTCQIENMKLNDGSTWASGPILLWQSFINTHNMYISLTSNTCFLFSKVLLCSTLKWFWGILVCQHAYGDALA